MIDSSTIVGLKYKGTKKVPFTFKNDNLTAKEMNWKKPGDVCDVTFSDAKWMVKHSPTDFDMVFKSRAEEHAAEPELNQEPINSGFVDSEEEEREFKRGPGRPKKDA